MDSVLKVRGRQYDNLAVIAFFPLDRSWQPRREGGLTLVNGGYTLTLYRRPVNPGWGQVLAMPDPVDSWVMGWPSLVIRWSIICLIKQERHEIIELLTYIAESHSSSDSGRLVLLVYTRASSTLWIGDFTQSTHHYLHYRVLGLKRFPPAAYSRI